MEHVKTVRHIGFRLLVLLLSLLPCEVVADTLKQDGVYGKIDNLRLIYEGNRLVSVHDDAAKLLYNGAVDFNGNAGGWASLRYTATGALKSDTGRGIALIEYDQWDNPRRVQFTNGNVTEYIYTATGEKLRTVHYTAMPNITVEQDTRHDLTEGEILYKDSTDYHDALIMENGRPSMYQFDGGYCSLWDKTSKTEELAFHYYTKDHLGNNREVVSEDGTVEQVTNYYPFGTPYSDHTAKGVSLQKYKYNGKELDLTHGLNTYDYGARQYYSVLLRWDRLDPLCTDYYHVSPYVYCMNNPVKFVDYKGFAPGDFFFTVNEAAIDFGMYYNDNSIRDKVEYGSSIFRVVNDKGQRGYTYTVANRGKTTAVVCRAAPFGYKTVAEIHAHGHSTAKELEPYLDNDFSGLIWADDNNIVQGQKLKKIDTDTDIGHANRVQRDSFITTPNGSLKKYEHRTGKVTLISTDMPSDYNDPDRKNNRSYLIEANPIKVNTEVEQERKMSLYGNY